MTPDLQTILAGVVVLVAIAYLVRSIMLHRKSGSDCGGCGPNPDKFKASLRK